MGLDKAIAHGKERREPYRRGGARVSTACRPGGSCDYCRSNRTIAVRRVEQSAAEQLKEEVVDAG